MPDHPLNKPSETGASRSARGSRFPERRSVPRHPFIADAEVVELNSGARLKARTSEVSLKGSYVDTMNPFPVGSLVQFKIARDNGMFETPGKVIYTQEGFGMGIAFTDTPPVQRAVLEKWLAELGS